MDPRETAREAVVAVGPAHQYVPLLRKYADVASGVWEPIVRTLLEHSDCHCGFCFNLKADLGD